jgi:proline dehydrogenase
VPLLDRLIATTIGWIPRPLVWKVARRYVAGITLDDAITAIRHLNAQGCRATVDLLGEFVEDLEEADRRADTCIEILETIRETGVDCNLSVKLTSFGLLIDLDRAYRNLRRVVERARELGNFVRLDMEDSPCTDATLSLFRRLRDDGLENAGLVLQAYLKRTLDDVAALSPLRPSYRLCKGIYVEPPEIAYKDPDRIRQNFMDTLEAMLSSGSYVGIATHDPKLVEASRELIRSEGLATDRYEFQMLLGVAEPLRRDLVEDGHRLRVYVPYGRDWYGYCVRRLKENPAIGRAVFLSLFSKR